MKEPDCKDKPDESPKDIESGKEKNAPIQDEISQDEKSQDKKEQSTSESENDKNREESKDKKPDPKTPDSNASDSDKKDQEPQEPKVIEKEQQIIINRIEKFFNKDEKESVFIDPTRSLPDSFSQLSSFRYSKDIEYNIEKLKEKRLSLLVCQSDDVLRSMAYTMVQHAEFKSYRKRMLRIDSSNAESDDLHLDMFNVNQIGDGENLVVLIEIEEQRGFFDSIFGKTFYSHQSTRDTLTKKNILLICMVNSSLMQKVLGDKQESFLFHRWEIDFLPYLLEYYLTDESDPDTLAAEILKQRDYGLWDRYRDDNEFYSLISGYLHRGKDSFYDEVKKRSEFIAGGKKPGEFWESLDKINADDLFSKTEPQKTVLYTATFFNELTPIDFKKVVILLLKDERKMVEKEVQIVGENNVVQTIKKEEEIILTDEWNKNADRILKECGLKVIRANDLSQYIDFSYPYLRNQVKKHIMEEHPMFLRQKFAAVQESGILFSPDVSAKIIENVIRLSAEMALINPAHYGAEWLINFIFQLRIHFNIPDEPGEDNLEELFRLLLAIQNESLKKQIYSRLASLIREMLNHSQLRGMINNFLNKLIEVRHHEEALEIVWEVGKRLRFAPNFDLLYWLKRLMEQGAEEIKGKAYLYLLELARQSKFQVYELLDSLKTWLPREDDDFKSYSKPQKFALIFVLEYCLSTALKFDTDIWGGWPSKYPLFYPLKKSKTLTGKRLKDLISWLLHPGLQRVLSQWLPEGIEIKVTTALADLFETWAVILLGTDSQTPHPEAIEGFNTLVCHLFAASGKFQRKEILRWWGLKRSVYRSGIHGLPFKEKEKREELRNKYKIASKLISEFNELKNKNIAVKEVLS
jgi:hypothetical protein